MKSALKITGIILLVLLSLTVKISAQEETTFNTKEDSIRHNTVKQHNDFILNHVEAMKNESVRSEKQFDKESYMQHAQEMKMHATKAKEYVKNLQKGEKSVKESETKFNKTIKHYDNILQEEFKIEKELGMPATDHHKLAHYLSVILNELKKIEKEI